MHVTDQQSLTDGAGAGDRTRSRWKVELVRAIQKGEGQDPCYMTDKRHLCWELNCEWRRECRRLVAEWRR